MGKNTNELNPKTGNQLFGVIDEIVIGKCVFPPGPIYLKHGEQRKGAGGFGIAHIRARHMNDLINYGYYEVHEGEKTVTHECVARYVSDILVAGASLHSEFENIGGSKILVIKRSKGMVVLQPKTDGAGNIYYSVVTAYPGQAKGSQKIGALAG